MDENHSQIKLCRGCCNARVYCHILNMHWFYRKLALKTVSGEPMSRRLHRATPHNLYLCYHAGLEFKIFLHMQITRCLHIHKHLISNIFDNKQATYKVTNAVTLETSSVYNVTTLTAHICIITLLEQSHHSHVSPSHLHRIPLPLFLNHRCPSHRYYFPLHYCRNHFHPFNPTGYQVIFLPYRFQF